MWMADPCILCQRHLLGEHGELHKFMPSWAKRHSIAGRVAGNQIEPGSYKLRHDELAAEMLRRGHRHESPLSQPDFSYLPNEHLEFRVDRCAALTELLNRCPDCRERSRKEMR